MHAHGTDHGVPYVATALAPGGSLRDLMRLGPVGVERTWSVVSGTAEALHRAHEAGLVHRDVKPGNVLFDAAGRPLLADFGLARTHMGFAVGSPEYMAPEQAMGADADRRSDVYALAAVVFEMLTGRPLRPRGESLADQLRLAVDTYVPPASQLVRGLPSYVDAVLERALAADPDERPQTAAELLRDLGLALGMNVALPPPSAPADGVTPVQDSTGRDRSAEFERQRAHLLRVVQDSLSPAVALDESSFIAGWNRAAELTFGWSPDEIVGRLLSTTLIPTRYQEAHERGFQRYLQGGESRVVGRVVEVTAMHRDGRELPVELSISPAVRSGARALVVGFVRDVGRRGDGDAAGGRLPGAGGDREPPRLERRRALAARRGGTPPVRGGVARRGGRLPRLRPGHAEHPPGPGLRPGRPRVDERRAGVGRGRAARAGRAEDRAGAPRGSARRGRHPDRDRAGGARDAGAVLRRPAPGGRGPGAAPGRPGPAAGPARGEPAGGEPGGRRRRSDRLSRSPQAPRTSPLGGSGRGACGDLLRSAPVVHELQGHGDRLVLAERLDHRLQRVLLL
ncbi:MAG: PAS domain S-box protein [Chloroflexi bacterium]|nr:MAG: PAS domain S-box protein [Chloroflexota bacterium]